MNAQLLYLVNLLQGGHLNQHTACCRRWYSTRASIFMVLPTHWPLRSRFHTISLSLARFGFIVEHSSPSHIKVTVHVWVTTSTNGPDFCHPIKPEIVCMESVPDCLGRHPSAILWAFSTNLWKTAYVLSKRTNFLLWVLFLWHVSKVGVQFGFFGFCDISLKLPSHVGLFFSYQPYRERQSKD